MALLSADDVLNKAFSKTKYREGFDQDEVDDFLDEVAHTITSLVAERDDLAQRLAQAQAGAPAAPSAPAADSAATQSTEGGLLAAATDPTPPSATGMLAMAQKLHDEYVQAGEETRDRLIDEGKAKAESIVEQAEVDAKQRMDGLEEERGDLERKIDDLRRFERDYRSRLKSYLENLLGDLDFAAQSESASSPAGPSAGFGAVPSVPSPAAAAAPAFEVPVSAQSASSAQEEDSKPVAPVSPWAQVRPSNASVASAPEAEQPAPWGASGYQPSTPAPQSDVASTFGAPVEPDSDNKNS